MYDDGRVACTQDAVVLRHYYFPAGSKRIPYQAIRDVRRMPLSYLGLWKIHGSSDFGHWFMYDPGRRRKQTAFVLDLGGWMKPVVTPDDPDAMAAALAGAGVAVGAGGKP